MYENMTFDKIEKRMLARVRSTFDKREGSIIYDATAPAALELAEAYIMARVILRQTFATTADREFLTLRAAEFNIYPEAATPAEVLGQFDIPVPLYTRFNSGNYNFIVTELVDDDAHTYKMKCEQLGRGGNTTIGDITPIIPVNGLTSAKIVKVITPGEDEEDTETFRERYFEALKSKAYGGNGADYKEKTLAIPGVGGVKVFRCWNGGGTVKLVIINTEYEVPDEGLVKEVQEVMDPTPQGKGYGLAPIGHTVTVKAVTAMPIPVSASVILGKGVSIEDVKPVAEKAIKEYFAKERAAWGKKSDTEGTTVRPAYILMSLLNIPGVVDVTSVKVRGLEENTGVGAEAVPVLGTLELTKVGA